MPPITTDYFKDTDFSRDNEGSDHEFYLRPRFVNHLDTTALETVQNLYSRLIPKNSRILDLMSGPDSHLNSDIEPQYVCGLGMNMEEMEANPILDEKIVHDVNTQPVLPFDDNSFDVVINTVSIDYLVKPVEIFCDVARILKPKGMFIVVFSNRMFPPKAVNIWKYTRENARVDLVKKIFRFSQKFSIEGYTESKGKPRPKDDKYFHLGIPSDPVYAVWAAVIK
ncbi:MAG: methyltransferase domain-containing protein [Syntrophaceae bacterium]|nr:methyltransferase domain-containing protein [Syntrophaceae bacterium]